MELIYAMGEFTSRDRLVSAKTGSSQCRIAFQIAVIRNVVDEPGCGWSLCEHCHAAFRELVAANVIPLEAL
jgi:hypothetical protein